MSWPQLPHSNSVSETHASFSRPAPPVSTARSQATGSSSQYTHSRQRGDRSERLSRVTLTSRRDILVTSSPVATVIGQEGADAADRVGEIVGPGQRDDPEVIRMRPVEAGALDDEDVLGAQQF